MQWMCQRCAPPSPPSPPTHVAYPYMYPRRPRLPTRLPALTQVVAARSKKLDSKGGMATHIHGSLARAG